MKNQMPLADLNFRKVDLRKDKSLMLELECEIGYANESYLTQQYDYTEYRKRWFSEGRPRKVLEAFKNALKDKRTMCDWLETSDGSKAGFFLVTFVDVKGFALVSAFLEDIYVFKDFRRTGIASLILKNVESRAKDAGAAYLHLGTSVFNTASCRLHEKRGFSVYRYGFEKKL
jgi:GNAT superfamily N-acetyltransferase